MKIKELMDKGFFHIFGSNVLNKVIQFSSGIFLVRILTKMDFGIFTYSQNLISFFLLMNGFGIMNGLLQFGTKDIGIDKKESLIKYSIEISLISNFIISLLIVIYSKIGIFKIEEARNIFLYMGFYPLSNILIEIIQIKNRIDLENKKLALNANINTFLNCFFMIVMGYTYGIIGVIFGKYLANLLTILYGFSTIKNVVKKWKKIKKIKKIERKIILKFSLISMLNNGVSQLLYIIDILLIGIIINKTDIIALYKTATLIPFALNFIPLSVMTYIYPYFSKNSMDKIYLSITYKQLIKWMFFINGIISMFLIVFSKQIIIVFFGEDYVEMEKIFQILSFGYFFVGTFRIPSGNLLAAIGQIKFNLYMTIVCGILNIILDIFFIKNYGSIGAAIATLIIFMISSIIGNYYIYITLYKKKKI